MCFIMSQQWCCVNRQMKNMNQRTELTMFSSLQVLNPTVYNGIIHHSLFILNTTCLLSNCFTRVNNYFATRGEYRHIFQLPCLDRLMFFVLHLEFWPPLCKSQNGLPPWEPLLMEAAIQDRKLILLKSQAVHPQSDSLSWIMHIRCFC